MSELRERPRGGAVDLDAEQEVDLGRYASALAARWWLALVGLILGAVVGYLLSLGGSQTYSAQAVVNLGTPLAAGGGILPNTQFGSELRAIVLAESTLRRVAGDTGLRAGQLRGHVSATAVGGATATKAAGPVALYAITVKGPAPHKAALAANELARIALARISAPYVDVKINTLESQVASDEQQLAAINTRIDQITSTLSGLTGIEKVASLSLLSVQEQRRYTVQQDLIQARPLLAQARTVERGRILTKAVASKATARSRRNSILVGAIIGLLLGLAAAIAWEPVASRLARRRAA